MITLNTPIDPAFAWRSGLERVVRLCPRGCYPESSIEVATNLLNDWSVGKASVV